jgi:hypothetical protein
MQHQIVVFQEDGTGEDPPRECSTTPKFDSFANRLHAGLRPREKASLFIKHDESTFSANDGKRKYGWSRGRTR